MNWSLQDIFVVQPIIGVTINSVFLSPQFRAILYFLIAAIGLSSFYLFFLTMHRGIAAVRRSIFVTFISVGIVSALYADFGWANWFVRDAQTFPGLSTDEKIVRLEGGFADFAIAAKKVLGSDYELYSSNSYMALRSEYFLLPARKRDSATDIIVLADDQARYDPATHTFTHGTMTVSDVEPLLVYAQNAYVLRKR
jgi:hypothetical protein